MNIYEFVGVVEGKVIYKQWPSQTYVTVADGTIPVSLIGRYYVFEEISIIYDLDTPVIDPLPTPPNLYTTAQSEFTDTSHINFRSNWEVVGGVLKSLGASNNDVRMDFDVPITAGRPHVAVWEQSVGTSGSYKLLFGGDGSAQGQNRNATDDRHCAEWFPASEIDGNFTRFGFNPTSLSTDVEFDNVKVYDVSSTDPTQVACDVILVLGDSIVTNAVSDPVTSSNVNTPFDPRCWYIPSLLDSPQANALTGSVRHVPQPLFEPAQSASNAQRISPLSALASKIVGYSATRNGRPLLLLSCGKAGTGLNGDDDWDKDSTKPDTGGVMYAEFLATVAAMQALGPEHQIIGAVVSLGSNDFTGVDYDSVWVPKAQSFIANVRADLGIPDLPFVWLGTAPKYEVGNGPDYDNLSGLPRRAERMRAAQASLAENSGHANAVTGVRFVSSIDSPYEGNGNHVPDAWGYHKEVHHDAAGTEGNGYVLGNVLRFMLDPNIYDENGENPVGILTDGNGDPIWDANYDLITE